ncbi:MAG: ATP-binding cassette domain-containing protein [Parasporobacterium sp.]|nr:ATP-binding cassette domain-containing protein [Parasporobacterium sp.]
MKLTALQATRNYIRKREGSNLFCAVEETSVTLEPGTLTVLSGPSGSGKSTLLNMFAGLLPPSSGQILLDDTDLYHLEDRELSRLRNLHIGIIPQGQTALAAFNVQDNILMPWLLYGSRKNEAFSEKRKRAEELMEAAGILELRREMPSGLSGGEIRRMAVCRAMLQKPEIILADEPTGDLDEENTAVVMDLLKEHAASGGTVFVVTHDIQVRTYADRMLSMRKGVVTEE